MGTAQGEALPIVLYLTFLTDVAGPSFLSVPIIIYVSSDSKQTTWSVPEVHAALAALSS
jgi:hypothetical protein